MDRRTLIFVVVSVLIIVLYQELVLKRYAPQTPEDAPISTPFGEGPGSGDTSPDVARTSPPESGSPDVEPIAPIESATEVPIVEGKRIRVETDLYSAVFTTVGGRLESFELKKYTETNAPDSPPLALVIPAPEVELPLGVELRGQRAWGDGNQVYEADRDELVLQGAQEGTLTLRSTYAGQPLVKRFTFRGDRYPIDLVVETPAATGLPSELLESGKDGTPAAVGLVLTRARRAEDDDQSFSEGFAALIDDDLEHAPFGDLDAPKTLAGPVEWAGFEDHYFLFASAPKRATDVRVLPKGNAIEAKILTPRAATGATVLDYTLYFGPKERAYLEAAGHHLERSLNLGIFAPIALLLLHVLDFSHRLTGNYGVDIILLTCLVKIAFWPLTQKSFQSMREMQKLQPEMQRLREKYKDDAKQMNSEIMELYKRHKVNPLGGCLPMVLQIPVFFGLYQLLASTIQLRHAPFVLWIHDLSAPERLDVMGYGIPVLTLLLGATMFLQQRMSPPAGDPAQQRIMMFMPLLFTFMFIGFPAGLTLYWLTNNVLTIAQQYFVLRSAPPASPS